MVDPSVYPFYQRLQQNPDDAEALFLVWQWHGDRGEFQQLATLAEQVAARRTDPVSAADLYYRAGELWAKNLNRHDKAVGDYRRAYELDPNQAGAIDAARGIYIELGNFKLAVQLLERQLGSIADPTRRLALLRELATVRAHTNEPSGQAAALEEVLKLVPGDFESMRELAGAYLARAETPDGGEADRMRASALLATIAHGLDNDQTVSFAESALDAWGGEEHAFAIVSEAYLAAGRAEDLALRQIAFIAANPDSQITVGIRKELAELYFSNNQFDDAIAALAPLAPADPDATRALIDLYRQANRGADLVVLLASLPASADPTQRIADLREIAELSGQQNDRAAVLSALREILTLDPADAEALALVEDDLRARNAFPELRQVLMAAAESPNATSDARKTRLREYALISDQRMKDLDGARAAWESILQDDPTDSQALDAVDKLLQRSERWDQLASFLERRAEAVDDHKERCALLERLADLHRDKRHDAAAEAEALGTLWALEPAEDRISTRLLEARQRLNDAPGVGEVLRARAEHAPPEKATERWGILASHLEQGGDRDGALDAWQRVTSLDPADMLAWAAVERILERTGRLDILIDTLVTRAEGPGAGERPAALHQRAAEIAKALGDISTAMAQARKAQALLPDDDSIAMLLMDVYEASGDRTALIEQLRDRAKRAPDGDLKVAMLRRLARTLATTTDGIDAQKVWSELREVAKRTSKKDDAEAVGALAGYAESAKDLSKLATLLDEWSHAATEKDEQSELLGRRADLLLNQLKDTPKAIATLQDLVTRVDPDHAETWGKIADLATSVNDMPTVANALERQLSLVEEEERKAGIAGRLADVCERELKDIPRTLKALEAQYDADPTDYDVVKRLAALYETSEHWVDTVKYLEVLGEVEEEPEQLIPLLLKISEIAERKIGSARKAFDVLKPAAAQADAKALDAMRGVAQRGKLEADLVAVLTELAGESAGSTERADLWREIAELQEGALETPDAALESRLKVVVARPTDLAGLDAVERLARERNQVATAAKAYSVSLAALDEPGAIHELATRGVRYLEDAGAPEPALDLALASQARAPGDDDLLNAVIHLAPITKRGDEMFVAFDRRRNATRDERERYALMLRAAECAVVGLGDRDTCFNYLRLATQQAIAGKAPDPSKLGAIEAMAKSVDETTPSIGLVAGVSDMFSAMGDDMLEDSPRAAVLLLRQAAGLRSPDRAYELLVRAVIAWPTDLETAKALEGVATAVNKGNEVAELYQKVISDAYDAQTARMYQTRRAALFADVLGRPDDAIEALRNLIELAPKDVEAVRMLQALLRKHERYQDLLMALERELEIGSPDPLRVRKEIARVWHQRLKNKFEAKDAWKRVLKLAPDDPDARAALARLERKAADGDEEQQEEAQEDFPPDEPTESVLEVSSSQIMLPPIDTELAADASSDPHDSVQPTERFSANDVAAAREALEVRDEGGEREDDTTASMDVPPAPYVPADMKPRTESETEAPAGSSRGTRPTLTVPTTASPPADAPHPADATEEVETLDARDDDGVEANNDGDDGAEELEADALEVEDEDPPLDSLAQVAASATDRPAARSSIPPPPPRSSIPTLPRTSVPPPPPIRSSRPPPPPPPRKG